MYARVSRYNTYVKSPDPSRVSSPHPPPPDRGGEISVPRARLSPRLRREPGCQRRLHQGRPVANFDGKEGLFLAVLDEEVAARRTVLAKSRDLETAARRYRALLDEDPGWTLAMLEFSIHAARHPELAEQLTARNVELRASITESLLERAPELSPQNAETAAKLAMAINTGVALERALDTNAAGEKRLPAHTGPR